MFSASALKSSLSSITSISNASSFSSLIKRSSRSLQNKFLTLLLVLFEPEKILWTCEDSLFELVGVSSLMSPLDTLLDNLDDVGDKMLDTFDAIEFLGGGKSTSLLATLVG